MFTYWLSNHENVQLWGYAIHLLKEDVYSALCTDMTQKARSRKLATISCMYWWIWQSSDEFLQIVPRGLESNPLAFIWYCRIRPHIIAFSDASHCLIFLMTWQLFFSFQIGPTKLYQTLKFLGWFIKAVFFIAMSHYQH